MNTDPRGRLYKRDVHHRAEYPVNKEKAIENYIRVADETKRLGLGLNAGHDLSLVNLKYFLKMIPWLDEVSIGHALICDALYLGLEKTISEYLKCLQ